MSALVVVYVDSRAPPSGKSLLTLCADAILINQSDVSEDPTSWLFDVLYILVERERSGIYVVYPL